MKAKRAWQAAVGQLQLDMPKANFDTWVKNTEFLTYEDGQFVIGVSNAYARDWLESRLTSIVNRMLTGIMNQTVEVRFVVWQDKQEKKDKIQTKESKDPISEDDLENTILPPLVSNNTINSRYTFDNFIIGASNRLAHAASLAVAEAPAQRYNPLFIYSGAGLGKTHLLHAIGNTCHENGLSVLYVSSEEFTNDLITAIRSHSTQAFRTKYRETDVLLIDDIQFIAGKESTQEEVFHTFNTLHGQNKQIVITSDRPPKAFNTLEERLRSRFQWGLTVDIQIPDYETRLAILQSKAELLQSHISDKYLELIAQKIQSNIRELEGALTRVSAFADLTGRPLSEDLIESALADFIPTHHSNLQPELIIENVALTYGITKEQLISKDRTHSIALPRQICMYLLRNEAKLSLPDIGHLLGNRDHTTVMYGCEKVGDLIERDERIRRQIFKLKENLFNKPDKVLV